MTPGLFLVVGAVRDSLVRARERSRRRATGKGEVTGPRGRAVRGKGRAPSPHRSPPARTHTGAGPGNRSVAPLRAPPLPGRACPRCAHVALCLPETSSAHTCGIGNHGLHRWVAVGKESRHKGRVAVGSSLREGIGIEVIREFHEKWVHRCSPPKLLMAKHGTTLGQLQESRETACVDAAISLHVLADSPWCLP
jgi:hypothetical protein